MAKASAAAVARQTSTEDHELEAKVQHARKLRQKYLAELKRAILYGADDEWDTLDPTLLVRSVLLLGTKVLGYHCEAGYHDELVAQHLDCEWDPPADAAHLPERGRLLPWDTKRWKWRQREHAGDRIISFVLAPRGTGKTVWACVLAIWYALRYRNVRILLTSKTQTAAVRVGEAIRLMLDTNPLLRAMFGPLRGSKWDKEAFNIRGRTRVEGANTFSVIGSGAQVASTHFEVLFPDDVATQANSRTEGGRETLAHWYFQSLEPTCRPTTDIRQLGVGRIHGSNTRYHPRDLHWYLPHESKDYAEAYRRFPLLRPSDTWKRANLLALRKWLTACKAARLASEPLPLPPEPSGADRNVEANWTSVCPLFVSVKQALHMRDNMPKSAFDAQYQVDARAMEGSVFKSEWIVWVDETTGMRRLMGCAGVDLAIRKTETADYTSLFHVKLDPSWTHPDTLLRGRFLIWDATVDRLNLAEKIALVLREHRKNRPAQILVEKTAAQALFLEQPQFAGVPVEGVTPTKDKLARASGLLTYFQQGRIAFVQRSGANAERCSEHMQAGIHQLMDFKGDGTTADDAVDALVYAVEAVSTRWTAPVDIAQTDEAPVEDPRTARARETKPRRKRRPS